MYFYICSSEQTSATLTLSVDSQFMYICKNTAEQLCSETHHQPGMFKEFLHLPWRPHRRQPGWVQRGRDLLCKLGHNCEQRAKTSSKLTKENLFLNILKYIYIFFGHHRVGFLPLTRTETSVRTELTCHCRLLLQQLLQVSLPQRVVHNDTQHIHPVRIQWRGKRRRRKEGHRVQQSGDTMNRGEKRSRFIFSLFFFSPLQTNRQGVSLKGYVVRTNAEKKGKD